MWLYELGQAYSPEQECEDWYQRNWPKKTEIYSSSVQLPSCPCSVFGLSRMWIPYRYLQSIACYRLSFGRSFVFYPYSKVMHNGLSSSFVFFSRIVNIIIIIIIIIFFFFFSAAAAAANADASPSWDFPSLLLSLSSLLLSLIAFISLLSSLSS